MREPRICPEISDDVPHMCLHHPRHTGQGTSSVQRVRVPSQANGQEKRYVPRASSTASWHMFQTKPPCTKVDRIKIIDDVGYLITKRNDIDIYINSFMLTFVFLFIVLLGQCIPRCIMRKREIHKGAEGKAINKKEVWYGRHWSHTMWTISEIVKQAQKQRFCQAMQYGNIASFGLDWTDLSTRWWGRLQWTCRSGGRSGAKVLPWQRHSQKFSYKCPLQCRAGLSNDVLASATCSRESVRDWQKLALAWPVSANTESLVGPWQHRTPLWRKTVRPKIVWISTTMWIQSRS